MSKSEADGIFMSKVEEASGKSSPRPRPEESVPNIKISHAHAKAEVPPVGRTPKKREREREKVPYIHGDASTFFSTGSIILHCESFRIPPRPIPIQVYYSRLQRRPYHRILLLLLLLLLPLQVIHGHSTSARVARSRFVRFPPGRVPSKAGAFFDIVDLVPTRAGEFLGPGTLLHGAAATAEFGAEVRGQEGGEEADFAEEGL